MSNSLKIVSALEAVSQVRSGQRVFLQGAAMTPNVLINALCEQYEKLKNVKLFQIHTEGDAKFTRESYHSAFITNSCFVVSNTKAAVNSVHGAYIPIFLNEIH